MVTQSSTVRQSCRSTVWSELFVTPAVSPLAAHQEENYFIQVNAADIQNTAIDYRHQHDRCDLLTHVHYISPDHEHKL